MPTNDVHREETAEKIVFDFDKAKINAVRFLWEAVLTIDNPKSRMTLKDEVELLEIVDRNIGSREKAVEKAGRILSGFLNFRQLNTFKSKLNESEESRYKLVTKIYRQIGAKVEKFINSQQPHVKAVYEFAYTQTQQITQDAEKEEIVSQALVDLAGFFKDCQWDLPNGIKKTSSLVGKVYDVHRWAAPSRLKDIVDDKPRFIRAALRFNKPKTKHGFVHFELLYRPYMKFQREYALGKIFRSSGVVLAIGEHLYLVGYEDVNSYPIVICCYFKYNYPDEFTGIVLRRKENDNVVFSSLAHFMENRDDAPSFDSGKFLDKLCISYYDPVTVDAEIVKINFILDSLKNRTDWEGRSPLQHFGT